MEITGVNSANFDDCNSPRLIGDLSSRSASDVSQTIYGIFSDENIGVNGKIDEEVFQGTTGDCWLISGVLSLANTELGAKLISDSISQNENGDYEVYFKGADKTYTITQDELENANKGTIATGLGITKSTYSTGDDDMLLIELALQKLVDEGDVKIETLEGLNGGSAYYLYQIFSDGNVEYAYGDDEQELLDLLEHYEENQDTCSAAIGVEDGFSGLEDNHAYAVESYDGETLSLINPWDTTKKIEISSEDLYTNIGNYDLSLLDETA